MTILPYSRKCKQNGKEYGKVKISCITSIDEFYWKNKVSYSGVATEVYEYALHWDPIVPQALNNLIRSNSISLFFITRAFDNLTTPLVAPSGITGSHIFQMFSK